MSGRSALRYSARGAMDLNVVACSVGRTSIACGTPLLHVLGCNSQVKPSGGQVKTLSRYSLCLSCRRIPANRCTTPSPPCACSADPLTPDRFSIQLPCSQLRAPQTLLKDLSIPSTTTVTFERRMTPSMLRQHFDDQVWEVLRCYSCPNTSCHTTP